MSLTKMQLEYLQNCNHRWNIKLGATGSGKTYLDVMKTIPERIDKCRGEGLIVLLGNTRGTFERNILDPMRELWGTHLVSSIRNDNTVTIWGKDAYVLGADSRKHVARLQGATIEYAYGDEITTWSQDVFEMLKSRLRCEHSHFDGTCNPANPNHWFKTFLDSDADIYQQKYVIDDGVLPADIVAELKKEYAGTVYYKRFILGEWALAEGIVYPMYAEAIEDAPNTPVRSYCLSIDYGTRNAFAALLWELHDGVWYATRGYYYSGRATGTNKTDDEYVKDLNDLLDDIGGTIETIVDPSAASFITLMRKQDHKYRVIEADNAVADGIRETAVAMQRGLIKVSPSIKEWRDEAEGYVYDETRGDDMPVKVDDHYMDSTRYFVKTKHITRIRNEYNPIYMRNNSGYNLGRR